MWKVIDFTGVMLTLLFLQNVFFAAFLIQIYQVQLFLFLIKHKNKLSIKGDNIMKKFTVIFALLISSIAFADLNGRQQPGHEQPGHEQPGPDRGHEPKRPEPRKPEPRPQPRPEPRPEPRPVPAPNPGQGHER